MRTTIDKLMRNNIYLFCYGAEGVGKTLLAMTLADAKGRGVAYITADPSGPTSVRNRGYPGDIPVELLPGEGEDPFGIAVSAINTFARDPSIHCICVDGLSVICGRAVDFLSGGEGEKALGFDGWGQVLKGFRDIEGACDGATRKGKSIILTAWEIEPEYRDLPKALGGGRTMEKEGHPYLQGKAQIWMPGNCDIVARMTSRFVTVKGNDGKAARRFQGSLHVNREGAAQDWKVKSRWSLPSPCPADLRWILDKVKNQSAGMPLKAVKL